MVECMSMEHWWNVTDGEKSKNWQRNLSQCHFVEQIPTQTGLPSNQGLHVDHVAIFQCVEGQVIIKILPITAISDR